MVCSVGGTSDEVHPGFSVAFVVWLNRVVVSLQVGRFMVAVFVVSS